MNKNVFRGLGKHLFVSYLPIFIGMVTGHLLFGLYQWTNNKQQINCHATNVSNNLDPPFIVKKPRILCYVNTFPKNYDRKAIHAQNTWLRRCDGFYFTSTVQHPNLSVLVINMTVPEIRMHLWVKMRKILRAVHRMADEYDYFFKADDDTYTFMTNMRKFLTRHGNPLEPVMWGYRWNRTCPGGFFSGGSGYILTREALKRIVERSIDQHPACPTVDENQEDVKMCFCGRAVGVRLEDARDANGTDLFYPDNMLTKVRLMNKFNVGRLLNKSDISESALEHIQEAVNRMTVGFSPSHISFHYIRKSEMYIYDFLTYYFHPFGLEP